MPAGKQLPARTLAAGGCAPIYTTIPHSLNHQDGRIPGRLAGKLAGQRQ